MTVHDWEDMRQRLALPREDPARPHVGWHWYVDGRARDEVDLTLAAERARAGEGFVWCGLKDPDDVTMATFQ